MQQLSALKPARSVSFIIAGSIVALAAIVVGCSIKPIATTGPPPKPYAGTTLSLSIPDSSLAAVLGPIARSWAAKTGATVSVSNDPSGDIRLFRPVAFGEAAAKGQILPLPKSLRELSHPYQMSNITDAYSEGIAGWAGKPFGVVLATDAAVLIYRKDRIEDPVNRAEFKTRFNRDLVAPVSWESAATIAGFFTEKDGKPSLPPLPQDPAKLLDLFHRVAACTDRPAITPSNAFGRKLNDQSFAAEAVSFHFQYQSGTPRLTSPGFALAAETLAALQPSRAAVGSDDPLAALEAGAIFAVATLSDLGRLPRGADGAVLSRFGVSRFPGTLRYYDNVTKVVKTASGADANFLPYHSGGWIGAIATSCKNAEAAFELLGEWGGPQGTAAVVGEPACGSGPWRNGLLDSGRKSIWYAYGFGADQTDALLRALKPYVATDIRNPVIGPRGPGMEKLLVALEPHVRSAIAGKIKPQEAMKAAQEAWLQMELANGPDVVKWRKADMRGE